jgi:hypothetical protein
MDWCGCLRRSLSVAQLDEPFLVEQDRQQTTRHGRSILRRVVHGENGLIGDPQLVQSIHHSDQHQTSASRRLHSIAQRIMLTTDHFAGSFGKSVLNHVREHRTRTCDRHRNVLFVTFDSQTVKVSLSSERFKVIYGFTDLRASFDRLTCSACLEAV